MIRALARLSVENAVAVNLATLAVCLSGLVAFLRMPREVFPQFSLETVTVRTLWTGASPEDVERLVTLPLEEELEGLDGLREMTSSSQEGLSTITLAIESDHDVQRFLDDARAAVDRAVELPDEAEEPRVQEVLTQFPAIAVFLYGNRSERELRTLAERHQRELEQIEGVSQVILSGTRDPRIWVEVDPLALERFGLTLADVGVRVGARSQDSPLGTLSTESGDFLLRVDSGVNEAEALRELPVLERPDGTLVRLHQVARVSDTFERPITRARFNGEPCVHLQVNKKARGDSIRISKAVREYVAREEARLPAGVALGVNSDLSVYVTNRLQVMLSSAVLGGMLVLISLVLFLDLRVAACTALGIPVAFLGGLLIAAAMGITMNMIVMFALIVVLGMIVDDAIVVGENVYRLMEEGRPPLEAAIEGTAEVGAPVMATVLTTIAAFLPLLLIESTLGQFFRPLPLIVSFCLAVSLTEALVVLPAHLADWTARRVAASAAAPVRRWYDPLRDAYVRFLAFAVRWRYATVALTLLAAALLGGVAAFRMPFNLFDDFESKVFYVNVRTPSDTPLEETERRGLAVESVARALSEDELESVNMLTGISFTDASQFKLGQNLAQVWVELREQASGRRPTSTIIEELRERFRVPPPGILTIDLAQPQAGPTGRAIDIAVRGPEQATLLAIAAELEASLAGYRGVRDVFDSAEQGKREVRVALRDHGRLLGFSEASLAAELRAAFEGTRFARVRRGVDDVEVIVKLPEDLRRERAVLERLRVSAPSGARVPLGAVAELEEVTGTAVISRDDGQRSVRVYADVNKAEGNATAVVAALQDEYADLAQRFPGYSLEFKGDHEDTAESLEGLVASAAMAAFFIYFLLGALFRSFSQPLVVMLSIPFAAIGVILGHLVMGRGISLMSLLGMITLAGVVVNDSLILVDFINGRRAQGDGLAQALVTAGRIRFRPIVLTSITTMLGLAPLTFFASGQARFLQPMAITIFFGLGVATLLTLVVIPCGYGILEDLRALLRHPLRTARQLWRDEPVHPVRSVRDGHEEPPRAASVS